MSKREKIIDIIYEICADVRKEHAIPHKVGTYSDRILALFDEGDVWWLNVPTELEDWQKTYLHRDQTRAIDGISGKREWKTVPIRLPKSSTNAPATSNDSCAEEAANPSTDGMLAKAVDATVEIERLRVENKELHVEIDGLHSRLNSLQGVDRKPFFGGLISENPDRNSRLDRIEQRLDALEWKDVKYGAVDNKKSEVE